MGIHSLGKSSTSLPHNKGSLLLNIKFVYYDAAQRRRRREKLRQSSCLWNVRQRRERERAAPTRDYTLAVLCVPLVALSLVTKWDFQQFVYSSHYQNTIFPPPPHSHLDEMNKNEKSLALSVSNARVTKSCQSFTFLNCDIWIENSKNAQKFIFAQSFWRMTLWHFHYHREKFF